MLQIRRSLLTQWATVCLLLQVSPHLKTAALAVADTRQAAGLLQGWSSIPQQSLEAGAALLTEGAPSFWRWLVADLEGVQDVTETGSLLNATDLFHQAQAWANDLQARGAFSGKQLAQEWKLQVYNSCLALVEDLLGARPKLQQLYFNYWNATYQRYAGYIEQARLARGFSPTGPLIDEVVQRFRAYTGTTCTPASFTPPADEDAEISGRGYVLTLAGGNCQITRVASQTRKDFVYRCALPRWSLAVTQARYSSKYVSPASFAGTVCRRQYTYGRDSTISIKLWNPGAFAQEGSRKALLLPLSDADGDGVPNFLDKLSRYQTVRKVLKSFRMELAKTLTQTTTTVEKAAHRLADQLKAAGLDVYINAGASKLQGELAARRAVREATRHDLSELFPDLLQVKLGKGVQYIYDKVLEHGLMATLYQKRHGQGPGGIFSMFQSDPSTSKESSMGQSAADLDSGATQQQQQQQNGSPEGEEDWQQDIRNIVPQDIFKRMTDEMEQLLQLRTAAQETITNPPKGRKVIKRNTHVPNTREQPATSSGAPKPDATVSQPVSNGRDGYAGVNGSRSKAHEVTSSVEMNTVAQPEGQGQGHRLGQGQEAERQGHGQGDKTTEHVNAGSLAASAKHLMHSLGNVFTQAARQERNATEVAAEHVIADIGQAFAVAAGAVVQSAALADYDYDDGGVEFPYDP